MNIHSSSFRGPVAIGRVCACGSEFYAFNSVFTASRCGLVSEFYFDISSLVSVISLFNLNLRSPLYSLARNAIESVLFSALSLLVTVSIFFLFTRDGPRNKKFAIKECY